MGGDDEDFFFLVVVPVLLLEALLFVPVAEEVVLRVTNQDPSARLSLDCTFAKTRALSVDCHRVHCDPLLLAADRFAGTACGASLSKE